MNTKKPRALALLLSLCMVLSLLPVSALAVKGAGIDELKYGDTAAVLDNEENKDGTTADDAIPYTVEVPNATLSTDTANVTLTVVDGATTVNYANDKESTSIDDNEATNTEGSVTISEVSFASEKVLWIKVVNGSDTSFYKLTAVPTYKVALGGTNVKWYKDNAASEEISEIQIKANGEATVYVKADDKYALPTSFDGIASGVDAAVTPNEESGIATVKITSTGLSGDGSTVNITAVSAEEETMGTLTVAVDDKGAVTVTGVKTAENAVYYLVSTDPTTELEKLTLETQKSAVTAFGDAVAKPETLTEEHNDKYLVVIEFDGTEETSTVVACGTSDVIAIAGEQEESFTVTVENGTVKNGTVAKDNATLANGTEFEVTPNEGFKVAATPDLVVKMGQEDVTEKFTYAEGKVTVTAETGFEVTGNLVFSGIFEEDASNPPVAKTYAITITDPENGTVETTVEGEEATEAAAGDVVTIVATPNAGYEVDEIAVKDAEDGVVAVAKDNTFEMPAKAVTVTVTFKAKTYTVTANKTGNGTVTVTPALEAGAAGYVTGTKVTITAAPTDAAADKVGSIVVDGTEVAGTEGENGVVTYELTITDKNVVVDVSFVAANAEKYNITIPEELPEHITSITPAETTEAYTGATVVVTVEADEGYEASVVVKQGADTTVEVTPDPDVAGRFTFVMPDADVTVTVSAALKQYTVKLTQPAAGGTLTAKAGDNNITADGVKVNHGATVEITAEAAEKYELMAVKVNGQVIEAEDGKYTVTVTADTEITADFEKNEYDITVAATENGTVTVTGGKNSAAKNTLIGFTTAPAAGYKVGTVTVTGVDEVVPGDPNSYTFTMPAADVEIKVTFVKLDSNAKITSVESGNAAVEIKEAETNAFATPSEIVITYPANTEAVMDALDIALSVPATASVKTAVEPTSAEDISTPADNSDGAVLLSNVNLSEGKFLYVLVTAEDGTTKVVYKITATKSEVSVVTPTADADLSSIPEASQEAVEDAASATNVALESISTIEQAAFAVVNADETISTTNAMTELNKLDGITVDNPEEVYIYVVPRIEVTAKAFDATAKSYKVDITPKAMVVASTAGDYGQVKLGATDTNAVVMKDNIDLSNEMTDSVVVEIGVPADIAGESEKVYVIHASSERFLETVEDGKVTVTVEHFSEFEIVPATDAVLDGITLSTGTLTPAFAANTFEYTVNVANTVASITVTPSAAAGLTAKVMVGDEEITEGDEIALEEGKNTIKIVVSGGELTEKTYTIEVTRAASGSNTPSGGSGGGSSSTTSYVKSGKTENGSFSISNKNAKVGATVTITPKANEGYVVDKVTVTDKNGDTVKVTLNSDGTYSFEMPSTRPVTVNVTFKEADKTHPSVDTFRDVSANDWFVDAVDYVLANNLMTGTSSTTFEPEATTTRGMVVTILYRLEKEPEAGAADFGDVADGEWYSKAVAWAAENNIVNGYDNGNFGPNDDITREQLVAILYRYSQFKKYDVTAQGSLSGYTDANVINDYAQTAMSWANATGLVLGTSDTTLEPASNATRAQVATVLMRFCEDIAK